MSQRSDPPAAYDAAQLFREHAARVERLLMRLGVQPCDVPDATQEVFVVAHRKRHAFEGRASVSTWLYRISVRVASAQRRLARHRREVTSDELTAAAVSGCDVAQEAEQRALLEHVAAALERLSEPQRAVLALHDLDGLRMREVAARLGIPQKTAFSRVYAARRALASELRRLGYAVPSVLPLWPSGALGPALGARVEAQAAWRQALREWLRGWQLQGLPWSASQVAGPLGIALCALLLSPHTGPNLPLPAAAPEPRAAALSVSPLAASAPVSAKKTEPASAPPAPASPEPPRMKPARLRTKSLPLTAAIMPSTLPEPEPDLIITRMGSENLRPVLPHPFASRVQSARPHLPHMAARLAPMALDPELPADFD